MKRLIATLAAVGLIPIVAWASASAEPEPPVDCTPPTTSAGAGCVPPAPAAGVEPVAATDDDRCHADRGRAVGARSIDRAGEHTHQHTGRAPTTSTTVPGTVETTPTTVDPNATTTIPTTVDPNATTTTTIDPNATTTTTIDPNATTYDPDVGRSERHDVDHDRSERGDHDDGHPVAVARRGHRDRAGRPAGRGAERPCRRADRLGGHRPDPGDHVPRRRPGRPTSTTSVRAVTTAPVRTRATT